MAGEADVMVAGGTESAITPIGVAGFSSLTALTKETDKTKKLHDLSTKIEAVCNG